jgi:fructokinase
MARQKIIVGIGEALIGEYPDREQADGLAVAIALAASRMGHAGVAVSRVGQDRAGSAVRAHLRERGVDVSHLQSDPDHATGRLVVRTIAGKTRRALDANAAFDQMQWDFDLADLAQQADAVVFGNLSRRFGQTQSTIDRFLAECRSAIRVFDATNRLEGEINRVSTLSGLANCDGVVLDDAAVAMLLPGSPSQPMAVSLDDFQRQHGLSFVGYCGEGGSLMMQSGSGSAHSPSAGSKETFSVVIAAILHGMLSGWTMSQCMEQADRIAAFARSNRDQRIPAELLMRGD